MKLYCCSRNGKLGTVYTNKLDDTTYFAGDDTLGEIAKFNPAVKDRSFNPYNGEFLTYNGVLIRRPITAVEEIINEITQLEVCD